MDYWHKIVLLLTGCLVSLGTMASDDITSDSLVTPIVDSIRVDSAIVDSAIVDSAIVDSAIVDSTLASTKDTTLYQGMGIKLDIATPILAAALSKGQTQQYELALNWRLRYRYFPTLELGYAYDKQSCSATERPRQGAFLRLGADINALKKNPYSPHALLVGLRVGVSIDDYLRVDSWGELVAGCQVGIYKGLVMGWQVRYKLLFTRTNDEDMLPPYIPGFGNRGDSQWGLSYYIGYTL